MPGAVSFSFARLWADAGGGAFLSPVLASPANCSTGVGSVAGEPRSRQGRTDSLAVPSNGEPMLTPRQRISSMRSVGWVSVEKEIAQGSGCRRRDSPIRGRICRACSSPHRIQHPSAEAPPGARMAAFEAAPVSSPHVTAPSLGRSSTLGPKDPMSISSLIRWAGSCH